VKAPAVSPALLAKVSTGSLDPYTLPCPPSGVMVTGLGVMAKFTTVAAMLRL
jgi:hypothetical protein